MSYLAALLIGLLGTLVLLPPLRRYSTHLQLDDQPDARKVHQTLIPRVGGMAMVPAWMLAVSLWMPPSTLKHGLLAAAAVLFVFCMLDDRFDLHYSLKFAGQISAAALLVVYGGLEVQHLPFGGEAGPIAAPILSVVLLVGLINAVNLIDGLDGLAGGSALIVFSVLVVLAYWSADAGLVIVCMAAIGSLLGFLRYNGHPAVVFMGDTGSQFLGLTAGAAAIYQSQYNDVTLSPLLPLALLVLPVADTALVFAKRLRLGQSPFRADKRHIHHRLMAAGLSHFEVVLALYLMQLLAVGVLFVLDMGSDIALLLYLLVWVSVLVYLSTRDSEHLGRQVRALRERYWQVLRRRWLRRQAEWLTASVSIVVVSVLSAFALVVLSLSTVHSGDVAALALALALALVALLVWQAGAGVSTRTPWLDKLLVYTAGAVVVYGATGLPAHYPLLDGALLLLLGIGFLAILLFNPSDPTHQFRLTPTDMLLAAAVAVLPGLPANPEFSVHLGRTGSQLIMVFYLLEFLLERGQRWRRVLCGVQSVVCGLFVVVFIF